MRPIRVGFFHWIRWLCGSVLSFSERLMPASVPEWIHWNLQWQWNFVRRLLLWPQKCVCVCVKFQATIAVAIQHNVLLLRLMDVHNNILDCSMVACPCPLHWQTIVFRLSLWIMLVNVAPSGAVTEMNFSSLFFQKHVPYVQVWSCLLECGCKRSWLCWPGQCF